MTLTPPTPRDPQLASEWDGIILPHYHPCRPYDRARRHTNGFACFDSDSLPEQQHQGYGDLCRDCQAEMDRKYRKYPIPDDGWDDPRYGGY